MLDIKYIKEHKKEIQEAARLKRIDLDVNELLDIDEDRRAALTKIDALRAQRNELAGQLKKGKPSPEQIAKGKKFKEDIAKLEEGFKKVDDKYNDLMVKVPTIPSADTPVGKDDSENVEILKKGKPRNFNFPIKDHIQLGRDLDLIDFERGTKVAGYRGYYLKNEAAALEMALMMFAMDKLVKKGFCLMLPPTLVKEFALFGSGYFAGRNYNEEVDEIYKIANKEVGESGEKSKEDKFLIGTAEPSLLAYYAGETLAEKNLPIKMCGFSQCYRSEIGSYGKDTKGLYRVHEFMKVEQVCIVKADIKEAEKVHQEMLNITKEIHEDLGLPYRILAICTGDMSAGKYKMFDIEAWIPSRKGYGETGSASNFLDWQSRRLKVKYKTPDGETKYVYMLNNTALASARPIIAILENFQQADGSVIIPKVLRRYMPGKPRKIKPRAHLKK